MTWFRIVPPVLALAAALLGREAAAGDEVSRQGDWSFTLGGGVAAMPAYDGADKYLFGLAPVGEIAWRDRVLVEIGAPKSDRTVAMAKVVALKWDLAGYGIITAGPHAALRMGRFEEDDDDLKGMGDIDGAVDAGVFLGFSSGPWLVGLDMYHDVYNDDGGSRIRGSVGRSFELARNLGLTLRADTTWADSDYMSTNFGVASQQSASSGMRAYDPGAGFKDVGLEAAFRWNLTPFWELDATTGFHRLVGDAADSPLVEDRGSPNQFTQTFTLRYRF